MKLSVMITCYNCENYINETINSVIAQDKPFDWELLIGDDGSNDNTVNIIKSWVNRYPDNIRLYVMNRDIGEKKDGTRAAKNRANLLRHASGDYLAFLDGDDQLLGKTKFVEQLDILESEENASCSGCAHNILVNDTSDIYSPRRYEMLRPKELSGIVSNEKYWKSLYFHTNTLVFRSNCKSMMLDVKYCDFLNDNFITYIVLQYGTLYYLDKVFAQYNVTGQGLWTGKKRVYGCFRNMILYDLELDINRGYSKASFSRHLYDFVIIIKQFHIQDIETIEPLFCNLNHRRFHYTYLMAKKEPYGIKQKAERFLLIIRVGFAYLSAMIGVVSKKIFRTDYN